MVDNEGQSLKKGGGFYSSNGKNSIIKNLIFKDIFSLAKNETHYVAWRFYTLFFFIVDYLQLKIRS